MYYFINIKKKSLHKYGEVRKHTKTCPKEPLLWSPYWTNSIVNKQSVWNKTYGDESNHLVKKLKVTKLSPSSFFQDGRKLPCSACSSCIVLVWEEGCCCWWRHCLSSCWVDWTAFDSAESIMAKLYHHGGSGKNSSAWIRADLRKEKSTNQVYWQSMGEKKLKCWCGKLWRKGFSKS